VSENTDELQDNLDYDETVIGPKSKKQEIFLNSEADITVFGGAAGAGKALRHGTPVMTKKGWVPIECINTGDVIPTPYDGDQVVTGVHPQGIVDIYRVTLQDGSSVDVCGNHLWKVRRAGDGFSVKHKIINTLKLKEILDNERHSKPGRKRWPIIELSGEVKFPKQDKPLPMHPYVLGCLLGDGGLTSGNTTMTSADAEIVNRIEELGYTINKYASKFGYGMPGIIDITRTMGIRCKSEFKVIPEEYMNASLEDRYELIRGLMDTDGTVSTDYKPSFCTTSETMCEQVQYLIRSVGGTATKCYKNKFYRGKDGEKVMGLPAYELYIRHPDASKLFHLTRKKNRCKVKRIGNRVLSVEAVGQDLATCISISGEDHQFITKDFIVTHNSYLGVMDFLQHIQYPTFRGMITRRTTPQLKGPGGILDNAMGLYSKVDPGVKWREKDGYFAFSSGARVYLRHYESIAASQNFQGTENSLILVDEGQQYEEEMIKYLMSRMRNPKCPKVKPRMKITCNPDYNSFLRLWLEWYLDPDTGIPLPDRDCITRWFVVNDGNIQWADSREEALQRYGKSDLPLDHQRQIKPLSFKFVSANVYDNPVLMKHNPEYVGWLEGLGRVEKLRLLHGSWHAKEETSGYFQRDWVEIVPIPSLYAVKRVRAWDLASSLPSDKNPNPDYTCGILMSKDRNGVYYVEDMVKGRWRPGGVLDKILETARRDGEYVTILIPQDPGQAGRAYAADVVRQIIEAGFTARIRPTNKSKVQRFAPFSALAEAGGVRVVEGSWNDEYLEELERFDGSRRVKDDAVDSTGDGFSYLASDIHLPDFLPEDFRCTNPYKMD
jgi:predicted phage terminase large subunit-like protein